MIDASISRSRDEPTLERMGYVLHEGALRAEIEEIASAMERLSPEQVSAWRLASHFPPAVQRTISRALRPLVERVLGSDVLLLHSTYLEKSVAANWSLAWHQDLRVAARRRIEPPGYGPSSVEAGIPYVQPTEDVLARLLIARVHLDDCGREDGALQVVPGSHDMGRLSQGDVARVVERSPRVTCVARRGDVLLMRPLLLHESPLATGSGRRRVLHLELAERSLGFPAGWYDAVYEW